MAETPTLSIAQRWEIADRYFAEGAALVERVTEIRAAAWAAECDPAIRDFAAGRWAHANMLAARARTRFRRHDLQLDLIDRDQAVLDANTEPAGEDIP